MGEAIVFTSGKGGVGKTTTVASIGVGLSRLDKKVILLDMDMGLRNLDVVMGVEDRVRYHLLDVLNQKCTLKQAIIHDKRYPNLYMIPAAYGKERLESYYEKLDVLMGTLKEEFDYCLIDCPAGIDDGFWMSIQSADRAILVTTPSISAIRDVSKVVFLMESHKHIPMQLLVNEYSNRLVRKHQILSKEEIEEILGIPVISTIPRDSKILISQNKGISILDVKTKSAIAYQNACSVI